MSAYYIYLISSLPTLGLANKIPFTLEEFFIKCKGLISEKELQLLHDFCYQDSYSLDKVSGTILEKWTYFEIALRNELVRVRSARKKVDPLKFIRFPDSPDTQISRVALAAYRSSSILEAEKILDQQRWDFLEQLNFGHYFDFDCLIIYALKLKILERWERIQNADKQVLFNQTILN